MKFTFPDRLMTRSSLLGLLAVLCLLISSIEHVQATSLSEEDDGAANALLASLIETSESEKAAQQQQGSAPPPLSKADADMLMKELFGGGSDSQLSEKSSSASSNAAASAFSPLSPNNNNNAPMFFEKYSAMQDRDAHKQVQLQQMQMNQHSSSASIPSPAMQAPALPSNFNPYNYWAAAGALPRFQGAMFPYPPFTTPGFIPPNSQHSHDDDEDDDEDDDDDDDGDDDEDDDDDDDDDGDDDEDDDDDDDDDDSEEHHSKSNNNNNNSKNGKNDNNKDSKPKVTYADTMNRMRFREASTASATNTAQSTEQRSGYSLPLVGGGEAYAGPHANLKSPSAMFHMGSMYDRANPFGSPPPLHEQRPVASAGRGPRNGLDFRFVSLRGRNPAEASSGGSVNPAEGVGSEGLTPIPFFPPTSPPPPAPIQVPQSAVATAPAPGPMNEQEGTTTNMPFAAEGMTSDGTTNSAAPPFGANQNEPAGMSGYPFGGS